MPDNRGKQPRAADATDHPVTKVSAGNVTEVPQSRVEPSSPPAPSVPESVSSAALGLRPGDIVQGRFEVVEVAGSGGMGIVYRAIDREQDCQVALKLLYDHGANHARFEREARLLAELDHPGIVGYVAHGRTAEGLVYLAMEWLEGLDLATLLAERRLTVEECVTVVQHTAMALAAAHERGIVHRDINPRNLFLVGGAPGGVKLLDFGIARLLESSLRLTAAGGALGTPGYIAPEQAQGQREVGASADVFGLGCVLFECLTGRRAFTGQTLMELLARILVDQPPRVSALQSNVPPQLDALVLRMLDKDPARRPTNAGEVLRALERLNGDLAESIYRTDDHGPPSSRVSAVTALEQRLCCVVMAHPVSSEQFGELTEFASERSIVMRRLRADGLVAVLASRGSATTQATEAARFALQVRDQVPAAQVSVATGRALANSEGTVGEAIERASAALGDPVEIPRSGSSRPIRIDAVTAGLLDSRFDIRGSSEGFQLRRERESGEPTRTVLGRQTRVLGRRRELGVCQSTLAECIEESVAHAVLVTGQPGIGKTRLAQEFLRDVRKNQPEVRVLSARGEPTAAGSAYRLMARALRSYLGLEGERGEATSRQKLGDVLAPRFKGREATRLGAFLGELLGLVDAGEPDPALAAAREDPVLLGDQLLFAVQDFVDAECARHPLLIVLDDFQWGDLGTVKLVDGLLRHLSERPLMVLALADPEVHQVFPELWARRGVFELQLTGLSRKASETLVRDALGDTVDQSTLDLMSEQAQGNPFWLEELVRARAEGQRDVEAPDAVIALAQARLERLGSEQRQVLRAASVFGDSFWLSGVSALLGEAVLDGVLEKVFSGLVEREVLSPSVSSRFAGQKEYLFSSSLYRSAAYKALPDEDRREGHLAAGRWLEAVGETDSVRLALHFQEGGQPALAVDFYRRGAEQALAGNDLPAVIARAEAGLAAGANGETAARLGLCLADAHKWSGDNQRALAACEATLSAAEEPSALWCRAAGEAIAAAGKLGNIEVCHRLSSELLDATALESNEQALTIALCRASTQLVLAGEVSLPDRLLKRAEQVTNSVNPEPALLGWITEAKAIRAGVDDPGQRMLLSEVAARHFEDAGDQRNACLLDISFGYACVEMGQYERAQSALKQGLAVAKRMGLSNSIPIAQAQLGRAFAGLGDLGQALSFGREACRGFDHQNNTRLRGVARTYLASIALSADKLEEAQAAAEQAVEVLTGFGPLGSVALAVLAKVELQAGDQQGALKAARQSLAAQGQAEPVVAGEALRAAVAVEVLVVSGHRDEARELLEKAKWRLLERADKIGDPLLKRDFLRRVPENAQILDGFDALK